MIDNQVELVITKASAERLLRQLLLDDDDLLLASSADSAGFSFKIVMKEGILY
jgi:hypothetical protein